MADIGIITFQLAGIHFGIHAKQILEIVQLTDVRKIPQPLPYVVGLTRLRKYLVAITDFRKRLGLVPLSLTKGTPMIVVRLSSGMFGILVESISHFRSLPETSILPPISIAGFPEQLLRGLLAENKDIVLIPDLDKIFTSYIKIQLLPITPSEKIAFQYRFTPGALTRTLEQTLFKERYLDRRIVHNLSRSLCLPSVMVHKVTSYYPHFHPRNYEREQSNSRLQLLQKTRAGDETYFSLSQKLSSQHKQHHNAEGGEKLSAIVDTEKPAPLPDLQVPGPDIFENTLQIAETFVRASLSGQSNRVEALIAHPEIGRNAAQAYQISPIRLSKYFSYYEQASPPRAHEQQSLPSEERSSQTSRSTFPSLEKRLEALRQTNLGVEQVLQTLSAERYVLTRHHLRWIGKEYRVPLVKLAKLSVNFPDLSFDLQREEGTSASEVDESPTNIRAQSSKGDELVRKNATLSLREFEITVPDSAPVSLCEYFSYLAQKDVLSQDHAVRYAASYLHVPTCRLSKLRSYYRFKG